MIDLEKVINELCFQLNSKEVKEHHYPVQLSARDAEKILALLKEQEVKEQISDAIHETAKQFRRQIVMCKDCNFKECEGRDGLIVCDITGESHQPWWFCADGEKGANTL